ncbi:MAG: tetratricopeptide repeat protein [Candidatus Hodarchaeales archaeon]
MEFVKILKETWFTIILLLLTSISIISGFLDSAYVITAFIMIGVFLGWLIYFTGFLRIYVARENIIDEKRNTKNYYSMKEWHLVDKKRDQVFLKALMLITTLLVVLIILFERLSQIPDFFTSRINETIELFVVNSWIVFAVLFILIYFLVIILLITGKLPEEMLNVFRGLTNKLVFGLSIIIYISIGVWAVINQFFSLEAVVIGFFILPIALVISRVEGKFFYLFAINQWSQFRKYDILQGSQFEGVGGVFKQLKALVALLIIPISVLSALLGIFDVITGNLVSDGPGLLESMIDSILIFLPELSAIILFLLTMGPLLILVIRPFAFVEVWLNQGLYEKMASPWDLDTLNDNMQKYSALFRIAHKTKGFRLSLFLSGVSILSLLGLNFVSSLITTDFQIYSFIQDGLVIVTFVTSIVFILTLIELSWDPIEEKTLLLFGRESRRSDTDLINYSLYGEWLLHETADMNNYLKYNPKSWGLPWFLKGLNLFYNDEERMKAFEQALSDGMVLLNSIAPIAWNDYGVLLTKSGRNDEALKAFMKGQKLLGKSEDEVMKEMGDMVRREPEPFLTENMMFGEPLAQTAMETPMYTQMAVSGGDSSSDDVSPPKKGRLLSYEELVGAEDKDSFVSLLDQRYNRRSRSKLSRNIAYLMQLRDDLESNWKAMKELNIYLELNPEDPEKWVELADLCKKMNFLEKARSSYHSAAEIYKSQGNNERYEEIMKKIDET